MTKPQNIKSDDASGPSGSGGIGHNSEKVEALIAERYELRAEIEVIRQTCTRRLAENTQLLKDEGHDHRSVDDEWALQKKRLKQKESYLEDREKSAAVFNKMKTGDLFAHLKKPEKAKKVTGKEAASGETVN